MGVDLTNTTIALGTVIVDTELRMKAMEELLIEKGVASKEEIEGKYRFVQNRDFEMLRDDLVNLIKEHYDKDEE